MRLNPALAGSEPLYFPDPGNHESSAPVSITRDPAIADLPLGAPAFIDAFNQLINGLPDQIALLDDQWNILTVNEAWTKTAASYDYDALAPGANYLHFCQARAAEGHSPAALVVSGIREIQEGLRDSFRFVYHGRDKWEGHAFRFCLNRIEILGRTFATATRYDVTELLRLRRMREDFSQSMIEAQGDERRRMARELHDSTMQLLVCLGLGLGQLKRAPHSHEALDIVADMEQILGEVQKELRSISYLAHPPSIAEMNLTSALKTLVEGFARRTGLRIKLDIDMEMRTAWRAPDTALYRVVQEALSNIQRHAQATEAAVMLVRRRGVVHVVVADNGIGRPVAAAQGVGLRSMRSRLAELGGRLMLRPALPGTLLIASVPLQTQSSGAERSTRN